MTITLTRAGRVLIPAAGDHRPPLTRCADADARLIRAGYLAAESTQRAAAYRPPASGFVLDPDGIEHHHRCPHIVERRSISSGGRGPCTCVVGRRDMPARTIPAPPPRPDVTPQYVTQPPGSRIRNDRRLR